MYQGHHTDGSSVQAHSVGDVYPFIVFGQECNGVVKFGVLSPNGDETPLTTCEEAHKRAAELKAAKDAAKTLH